MKMTETEHGFVCASCGKTYPSIYWFKRDRNTGAEICIDCRQSGLLVSHGDWEDIVPPSDGEKFDKRAFLVALLFGGLLGMISPEIENVTVPWFLYRDGTLKYLVVRAELQEDNGVPALASNAAAGEQGRDLPFNLIELRISKLLGGFVFGGQRGAQGAARVVSATDGRATALMWFVRVQKSIPFWECNMLRFKLWGEPSSGAADLRIKVSIEAMLAEDRSLEHFDLRELNEGSWRRLSNLEKDGDRVVLVLGTEKARCDLFKK